MKKKLYITVILAFAITIGIVACGKRDDSGHAEDTDKPVNKNLETITFAESKENIPNPERGLYTYKEFITGETSTLTANEVRTYRKDQSITLFYTIYYMPDFRNKPISDDYLQRIRANMQALRDGGGKAVLRFSYTKSENDKPWDAPWEITKNHIEQLTPIFQEYMDVISFLQAGFIGVWGEWYYTDNYIFEPKENEYAPRKQVLDALLKALPKERMVCIRYPKAKINILGITHADSITIAEAYNYSDRSRIAGHNDCFLADDDDTGTFNKNMSHRKYWENESRYYAMGGETCAPSSYAECTNAMINFRKYHWSYLNIDYRTEVIEDWKLNGCFDEIQRLLGYRIVLSKVEYEPETTKGNTHEMTLTLKNIGWAAPYNPRNVEIVMISTDGKQKKVFKLDEDPRFWFTDKEIKLDVKVELPSDMQSGKYNVCLNLPDPTETLYSKPEFSIQCANNGVWDSSTGYNKLYELKVK
ncbi:hypothetical protein GGR21_003047 [Dysgonomonas hofstadii]|uniref:DUF4832 domain-containing protein n=1 Tax=Dysgonomonas hofstadii TaxID=637886 RepID=A0A840CXH6_9BACT|nr:DUF4832 domain-containing protein [Dysgonomonas hofstadii]MBB4037132.1 hypothetical protein [Dysgonomonas hofstadii]